MLLESLQTKHVVFTTESKESYQKKEALGYDENAGYKALGYECNVLVETHFSVEDGFWLDVRMCQDRAALMARRAAFAVRRHDRVQIPGVRAAAGQRHRGLGMTYPPDLLLTNSRTQNLKRLLEASSQPTTWFRRLLELLRALVIPRNVFYDR